MNTKNTNTYTKIISGLGEIELKAISLNDLIHYEEAKVFVLPDKDFTLNIILKQLLRPTTSITDLEMMDEKILEEIARAILRQELHHRRSISQTGDFYNEFKLSFLRNREQQNKLFRKLGRVIYRTSRILTKSEKTCNKMLLKYKWFLTPSFPIQIIPIIYKVNKENGRKDTKINKLFVEYFGNNNWENLETMVRGWKNSCLLKKRYKILIDCVSLIKLSYKRQINGANVVLPTLITQIDGAFSDYLELRVEKPGRSYQTKKTQFETNKPDILPNPYNDSAFRIFTDILYQKYSGDKPLELPFGFNRHKIMHGANVVYGRKTYMIRAFMILDLFSDLK
jgi:hypothetical protein